MPTVAAGSQEAAELGLCTAALITTLQSKVLCCCTALLLLSLWNLACTDRQTDTETDGQTDSQTDREKSSPPEPNSYYNKLRTPSTGQRGGGTRLQQTTTDSAQRET